LAIDIEDGKGKLVAGFKQVFIQYSQGMYQVHDFLSPISINLNSG